MIGKCNTGGGGKPEEEKTVTAGTSTIEVLPSSGKTMKKVTVNPTPSQSKSVTPKESAQTVSPDSGKLLSSVSVSAINTETKTVTAGTNQTTVVPSSGKYIKKVTVNPTPSQSKTVTPSTSQQTVSPNEGYLLNKVIVSGDSDLVAENIRKDINIFGVVGTLVEGVTGIDFGEVKLSDSSYSVKVAHNLGVVPSFVALIPKTLSLPFANDIAENINGKILYSSAANTLEVMDVSNKLTSSEITFQTKYSGQYIRQDYYWIAIA